MDGGRDLPVDNIEPGQYEVEETTAAEVGYLANNRCDVLGGRE